MRIIEQKGEYSYVFSRYIEPVAKVAPGEEIVILTEDPFLSMLKSEDDDLEEVKKKRRGSNPQTGPIYIEGAKAGDTLKVHILDIEPARDWAVSCIHKFFGGLTPNKYTRMINVGLSDKIYIYRFDNEGMLRHDDYLRFPWKPFLGTIATAPVLEALSALTPFENGGNMDSPDVKPGNIIYLPVSVDGAYFFTGDCHACQGEGELCGTALEITAKVKLKFELVKGKTIILDESLLHGSNDGRLRFTCAHEIAHWLLHRELYTGTGQAAAFIDLKKSSDENPAVERQANQLATLLLMPTVQVKRAFYTVRNTPDPAASLAILFGASKQAMGIFMREHNLT